MAVPVAMYAFCEWVVLYFRKRSMERKLGIANLACAAFTAFGVVANVSETLGTEGPTDFQFLFWLAPIGALITAYLVASGWFRLRWTRCP